jgi:hypothetical protein
MGYLNLRTILLLIALSINIINTEPIFAVYKSKSALLEEVKDKWYQAKESVAIENLDLSNWTYAYVDEAANVSGILYNLTLAYPETETYGEPTLSLDHNQITLNFAGETDKNFTSISYYFKYNLNKTFKDEKGNPKIEQFLGNDTIEFRANGYQYIQKFGDEGEQFKVFTNYVISFTAQSVLEDKERPAGIDKVVLDIFNREKGENDNFNKNITGFYNSKVSDYYLNYDYGLTFSIGHGKQDLKANVTYDENPFFEPDFNGLIQYYSANLYTANNDPVFDNGPAVPLFKHFQANLSDHQVFINKKLFALMFNYTHVGKTYRFDAQSDLDMPFKFNVNYLADYFPNILLSRYRGEQYFVEMTIDDLLYTDIDDGIVSTTVFLVSKNDNTVILSFNFEFVVLFEVAKGDESKINVTIKQNDVILRNLIVLSDIGAFDQDAFEADFIDSVIKYLTKNNVSINKDAFDLDKLFKGFTDIIDSESGEGFILYVKKATEQKELKFLN